MDREFLDLYSDYLISAFGKVTALWLSELIEGELSHDQITSRLRKNTGRVERIMAAGKSHNS